MVLSTPYQRRRAYRQNQSVRTSVHQAGTQARRHAGTQARRVSRQVPKQKCSSACSQSAHDGMFMIHRSTAIGGLHLTPSDQQKKGTPSRKKDTKKVSETGKADNGCSICNGIPLLRLYLRLATTNVKLHASASTNPAAVVDATHTGNADAVFSWLLGSADSDTAQYWLAPRYNNHHDGTGTHVCSARAVGPAALQVQNSCAWRAWRANSTETSSMYTRHTIIQFHLHMNADNLSIFAGVLLSSHPHGDGGWAA